MIQQYSQTIKQHYNHPLNTGRLSHPTHTAEALNPLCGDETKVYLKVENSIIKDIRHETRGCMICVAAASILSEYIKNKSLEEIENISTKDLDKFLGITISPARESCATLALQLIQKLI